MVVPKKNKSRVGAYMKCAQQSLVHNSCAELTITSATSGHLGVVLTLNLSWTPHIEAFCSKARHLIGLVYRNFDHHASPQTLLNLYTSLILPHLSHSSSVWDPPSTPINAKKKKGEKLQHFALKMCLHSWNSPP